MSMGEEPVGNRGRALIVSPGLSGHRVIYCLVFARLLAERGFAVRVAAVPPDGDMARHALVARLEQQTGGRLMDLRAFRAHAVESEEADLDLETLAALTREARAAVTLLAEADDLIPALAARLHRNAPPISGRLMAVFLRSTNYRYHAPSSLARRLKSRLRRAHRAEVDLARFHERLVIRRKLVDSALVLDERYAFEHHKTHLWLPDIFRDLDAGNRELPEETQQWARRLDAFSLPRASRDRPVVVYTGTSNHRRGYETLLRLTLDEGGVFMHCGKRNLAYESRGEEVSALRAALAARGALIETDAPYLHPETAEMFLRRAQCVVLPYWDHDGSSGAMLQAIAAGRPVLVRGQGLMAYRARTFGLGETCVTDTDAELRRRFREMHMRGPGAYERHLREYIACFSREQVASALDAALGDLGTRARLPQDSLLAPLTSGEEAGP